MAEETRSRRESQTTLRARNLRHGNNIAEGRLWNELKDRRLNGFKFVRQFPIGPYFADFLCRQKRLVVEIDGSQHEGSSYDRRRDEFMRQEGYSVLRFWNVDVLTQLDPVLETIVAALDGRLRNDMVASDIRVVIGKKNVETDR
jgi:very-short-patch-repair endonuclease